MGLGSLLGGIGSLIAAPFTGGGSLAWLPAAIGAGGGVLDAIGSTTSGAAQGSQQGRLAGDLANASIYNSQVGGAVGLGNLDLAKQKFKAQYPGAMTGDVVRGSLLNGMSDVSLGGPGHWKATGGMRPSALGPEAKQAIQMLIAQQLQGLKTGPQFANIPMPQAPQQSQAGTLEKILGGLGMGAGILGSLSPFMPKKPAGGSGSSGGSLY